MSVEATLNCLKLSSNTIVTRLQDLPRDAPDFLCMCIGKVLSPQVIVRSRSTIWHTSCR